MSQSFLSNSAFTAWLKSKPPKETYNYYDHKNCLCAQYFKAMGFPNAQVSVTHWKPNENDVLFEGHEPDARGFHLLPIGWNTVAQQLNPVTVMLDHYHPTLSVDKCELTFGGAYEAACHIFGDTETFERVKRDEERWRNEQIRQETEQLHREMEALTRARQTAARVQEQNLAYVEQRRYNRARGMIRHLWGSPENIENVQLVLDSAGPDWEVYHVVPATDSPLRELIDS